MESLCYFNLCCWNKATLQIIFLIIFNNFCTVLISVRPNVDTVRYSSWMLLLHILKPLFNCTSKTWTWLLVYFVNLKQYNATHFHCLRITYLLRVNLETFYKKSTMIFLKIKSKSSKFLKFWVLGCWKTELKNSYCFEDRKCFAEEVGSIEEHGKKISLLNIYCKFCREAAETCLIWVRRFWELSLPPSFTLNTSKINMHFSILREELSDIKEKVESVETNFFLQVSLNMQGCQLAKLAFSTYSETWLKKNCHVSWKNKVHFLVWTLFPISYKSFIKNKKW